MTAILPFTAAWADAFCDAINADDAYRAAASGWTWPVALVVQARPDLGIADDTAVEVALDRGRCTAARAVPAADVTADIALRGAYDTWKRIVQGALDPVTAVTTGKLVLVRGSLATLLLHTAAARALVACAARVPTAFPDEQDGGGAGS